MNWIQNRFAMISMLGIGGLMLVVAYQTNKQSEPTAFEITNHQEFDSLREFGNANLLEADLSSHSAPIADPEALSLGAFPEENLASVFNEEEFSPAELEGPLPEVNPAFAGIVNRYEALESTADETQFIDSPETYTIESDEPSFVQTVDPAVTEPAAFDPSTIEPSTIEPMTESSEIASAMVETETVETMPAKGIVTKLVAKRGWQSNPFINAEMGSTTSNVKTEPQAEPTRDGQLEFFKSAETKTEPMIEAKIETAMPAQNPAFAMTSGQQESPQQASPVRIAMEPAVQRTTSNRSIQPAVMTGISESASQRAAHHIEYGKSLARRNAAFAARQEFYSALGVLAQSNDTQSGSNTYTTALRNAVVAMNEAEDFVVSDTESQVGMEVDTITSGHATKIIGQTQARHMSPSQAMQRYMAYAGQQLEIAGGQNVVSAEALFCLGKLHHVLSSKSLNPNSMDVAKSMVYHRASLGADETNAHTANELAVLLAQSGKTKEAKWLLKQSLLVRPMPQAWGNLAKLHERSGEFDLARLAMNERQISLNGPIMPGPSNKISWVSPEEFIAASSPDVEEYNPVVQASAEENPVEAEPTAEPERKSIAEKIKDVIIRR